MRVCVVYDCLFPWTIGGAERWYRALAERLAADGHQVTYLTMKQWDAETPPDLDGVEVIAVAPRMALYGNSKRRIAPPLRFGLGVLLHLAKHGRRYDVVHLGSFPYFALLAAGAVRPIRRYRIVCDWHEVWTDKYWRNYLGRLGWIGRSIQSLCAGVRQHAQVFSRLNEIRLRSLGVNGDISYLPGLSETAPAKPVPASSPPTVVYAGRMIAEKRVGLLVEALAIARHAVPELRATLFGDGPDREAITEMVRQAGLTDVVALPGFVEADILEQAMREAICIVQPSEREGYGIVVVEASARGVPVIVVAAPDNAAVELVSPGANGFVADPTPSALAHAIVDVVHSGETLRRSTQDWYAVNAERLSIGNSLRITMESYCRTG